MPAIAIASIAAAASGGAAVYAANKTSGAAEKSAQLTTDAATKAADLQKQSTDAALAFQRQQAEQSWQQNQQTQQANYQQWKARESALGSLGSSLGMNVNIPDYAPGIDPHFETGATPLPANATTPNAGPMPSGGSPSGAVPSVDASKGDIATQVAAYYQARGVTPNPTSVAYWASKWNEFGAKDPAYFNQRLAQADEFSGGAGGVKGGGTPGAAPTTNTLGSLFGLSPVPVAPTTPIPTPYQPGTIGAYVNRAY